MRDWQKSAGALFALAVFVSASILFLSTLSAHYCEGEDSASWVTEVTYGSFSSLFNPHHIGFLGISRLVYQLFLWCGYTRDAGLPMKAMNALAGALTLGLLVRALDRVGADKLLILVWVSATAASFGFWSYSTQPETYVLPLPAILLGINIVIGLADHEFSPWSLGLLGGSMALATLINQMHVLLIATTAAAVVLVWYRRRPEIPASRLLLGLASFGGTAAVIIAVAYFGVTLGIVGCKNLGSIIAWSKGYASDILTSRFSITDLIKGVIGIARAVLGGHFLFGFDWFHGLITCRLPAKLMMEERYLALGLSPGVRIACLVAAVAAALSGVVVLLSLVRPGRRRTSEPLGEAERRRYFALDAFTSITLLVCFIFNVVWEPTNDEFWIAPLPIAYVAIASVFARRPPANRMRAAGALFAVSLFIANGLGVILPQTKLESDYWYQANRYLIENARPGDVVVTDGGFISDSYLGLYTRSNVVPVHKIGAHELSSLLAAEHPGRVWVSSWAFEPSPQIRATGYLKKRDEAAIQSVWEKVKGRLIKRDENPWQTVWELEP
jgi:hypothetical protein